MNGVTSGNARPWYREPWPWFLMIGPLAVVIAGFYTLYLAIRSSDGLVTESYYQEGLRAGETVAKSERAAALGVRASLSLREREARVRLTARDPGFAAPAALTLALSHPTRAGLDRKTRLSRDGEVYRGEIELPASGHWLVLIEDEENRWRLMGSLVLPAAQEVTIGGE